MNGLYKIQTLPFWFSLPAKTIVSLPAKTIVSLPAKTIATKDG